MSDTPLFTLRREPNGLRIHENREHQRLTVGRTALHRDFVGPLAVLRAGNRVYVAAVLNVSPAGIGLVASQRFKLDTELVAKLFTAQREFLCTRTLRVAHATPREDSCFNVGGTFDHLLTEEQLRALRGQLPEAEQLERTSRVAI